MREEVVMNLDVIDAEKRAGASAGIPAGNVWAMPSQRSVRDEPEAGREQKPGVLWRVLCVVIGAGLVVTGWALMMTAILSFIGLPVFIFGLALMQSAER
ncbi:MAG: hypothetical protein WB297_01015 [Actinomycetota bacterium]